jgi:cadmium resistance protein CadD (predicted permease)
MRAAILTRAREELLLWREAATQDFWMLADLGTATLVFVATNVDDILLLAVLFGSALRARAVVAGQFIGIAVLTAVSVGAAYAATAVPQPWLRALGALPIAMGVWLLVRLWRHRGAVEDDDDIDVKPRVEGTLGAQIVGVTAITIANGGDNLSVYIPLFANSVSVVPLYVAVFTVLTGVWCALGHALVKNPLGAAVMQRWGHLLLPFVLIAIGVHILLW